MPLFCKQCNERRLPKSVKPENSTLWLCEKGKNFVDSNDFIVREATSEECNTSQEDYKKWFLETQIGTEFPLGDPKPKQQPKGEEVVEEVDEFAEFVEN